MDLTACVITGVVWITLNFDLLEIALKQVEIFLHEFLKYRFLIKISPGTVGDIWCVASFCHPLLMYVPPLNQINTNNLRIQDWYPYISNFNFHSLETEISPNSPSQTRWWRLGRRSLGKGYHVWNRELLPPEKIVCKFFQVIWKMQKVFQNVF